MAFLISDSSHPDATFEELSRLVGDFVVLPLALLHSLFDLPQVGRPDFTVDAVKLKAARRQPAAAAPRLQFSPLTLTTQ
jgi:hypothetical protein